MNKKSSLLAFMLGMAVGSLITYQMMRERYERRIEEDRKSLKEMYSSKNAAEMRKNTPVEEETEEKKPSSDPREIAERAKDKPDIREYTKRLREEGYIDYTKGGRSIEPKSVPGLVPYVITPEEFGEVEGYEKISLTYFADGVLADEDDEAVEDVEELIGDGLEHFGEYEDDSVFVRNEERKSDYEILRDLREFSEVLKNIHPR